MKKTCWKLFSYLTIDHEAAQNFLNSMARKGWEPDIFWTRPLIRFKKTGRTDLCYFLDWADPTYTEDPEYLRLCEDSGWVFLRQLGYWNLYVSRPGVTPTPIQTDPKVEYERFREKVLHRMAIGAGLTVLVIAIFFSLIAGTTVDWGSLFFDSFAMSYLLPFALLFLPFGLTAGLVYMLLLFLRLSAWKKAVLAGEPSPSSRAPEFWKTISGVFTLMLLPFLPCMLIDFLLNGTWNWGYPIGIFIGSLLNLTRKGLPSQQLQQQSIGGIILAAIMVLCMLLHGPVRSVFPGRLPTAPIVETNFVDDGRYSKVTRSDGLLGSEASWWERGADDQGQPDPRFLYHVSAQTWLSPAFAEKALEKATADMTPLEGTDGVWFQAWETQCRLLFLRGTTLLEISNYDYDPEVSFQALPIYPASLAWLEQLD